MRFKNCFKGPSRLAQWLECPLADQRTMGSILVKGIYLGRGTGGRQPLVCVSPSLSAPPPLLLSDKQWKKYPQVRINPPQKK